jgi:hypothetical protein
MDGSGPTSPPFPVLGLPSWPGPQRTVLRQGAGSRTPDPGVFGEPVLVATTRAYFSAAASHPLVVIGQSRIRAGRDLGATAVHGSALSYLLRPRTGRPRPDRPVRMDPFQPMIGGAACPALRTDWDDDRIEQVCLDWLGDFRIEIASWLYPLTADLFGSLQPLPEEPASGSSAD